MPSETFEPREADQEHDDGAGDEGEQPLGPDRAPSGAGRASRCTPRRGRSRRCSRRSGRAAPPRRARQSEKTGAPSDADERVERPSTARRGPRRATRPTSRTPSVCPVIGTGQSGIATCARRAGEHARRRRRALRRSRATSLRAPQDGGQDAVREDRAGRGRGTSDTGRLLLRPASCRPQNYTRGLPGPPICACHATGPVGPMSSSISSKEFRHARRARPRDHRRRSPPHGGRRVPRLRRRQGRARRPERRGQDDADEGARGRPPARRRPGRAMGRDRLPAAGPARRRPGAARAHPHPRRPRARHRHAADGRGHRADGVRRRRGRREGDQPVRGAGGGVPRPRRLRGRGGGGVDLVEPLPAGPDPRPAAEDPVRRSAPPHRAGPHPVLRRPHADPRRADEPPRRGLRRSGSATSSSSTGAA